MTLHSSTGRSRLLIALMLACWMPLSRLPAQETSETVAAAAKRAYNQGQIELGKGNHTGAVTLFEAATRMHPESALYHHSLGKAHLGAEQYEAMWNSFRKAAFLSPGSEEIADDFMRIWKFHDLQGTINCGTPDQEVLAKLGEPDKRVENANMKRWVYGFVAIDFGQDQVFRAIDLRGYDDDAANEIEWVKVQTDPTRWTPAHHMITRRSDNLELTTDGEKVQNWTQLFSKQRFPLMSRTDATVKGMVDSLQRSLSQTGALVQFEVIEEKPDTMTFHWRTKAEGETQAQHEVVKILKGQKDFYRVAYVKKSEQLSDAEFEKWSRVIGDAVLVPRQQDYRVSAPAESSSDGINAKLAAWELGKNLSFAALLRGRHGPDETVKATLLRVSKSAHMLGVDVPAPDALTEDPTADTAAAINFLLNKAGKTIYNSLEQQHGQESSAVFELGTKTTLALMLYQPGDSTSSALASAIERSAKKAQLDPSLWRSLVRMMTAGDPADAVREAVMNTQKQITDSLGS